MRPALENGCRQQTASAKILFFHTIFLISKCREKSDLGVRTFSRLVKKRGCAVATFNEFLGQMLFWIRSRHRAAALLLQVPENCTNLDVTLLYISISRAYSKIALKNKMLALAVCFPQQCSSAGHRSPANTSRLDYYLPICSWRFPQKQIRRFAL